VKLWMSRAISTKGYTFWRVQPEITWDRDEPVIGFSQRNGEQMVCNIHNIHVLFPHLSIPPGEMVEVEIIPLERGYYFGGVEE